MCELRAGLDGPLDMKVLFVFSTGRFDDPAVGSWLTLLDTLPSKGVEPLIVVPNDVDDYMALEFDKRGIPWRKVFFTRWILGDRDEDSLSHKLRRAVVRQVNNRADKAIGKLMDEWGAELLYICAGTICAGLSPARERDLPVVWHVHHFLRNEKAGDNFVETDAHVGTMLASADAIIASCKSIKTDIRGQFPGCRNIKVIYNGVPEGRVYEKQHIFNGDDVVFTLTARFEQNKRHIDALRAFEQVAPDYPEMRLRFVGTGDKKIISSLKSEAAASPVASQVEFAGYVDDISEVWEDTDVALNCSYSEGCSMAVGEAMTSGCLLLCSTAEGNVEIVDGSYGLLYERAKVPALAAKMRWVMENKREAQRIAGEGKLRAAKIFSAQGQADAVYKVFSSVAHGAAA